MKGKSSSKANCLGYSCAVAYGVLIPSFLIYLIVKQHVTMTLHRRFVFWAEAALEEVVVRVKHTFALEDSDKDRGCPAFRVLGFEVREVGCRE